jgi:DNA-binding response OmpR family regulator
MKKSLPTILVLEREERNLKVLKTLFETTSLYKIIYTTTFKEAEEYFKEEEISLVLLDISYMSKSYNIGENVPIILLMDDNNGSKEQADFTHNILDFILRPYDIWQVLYRIKKHIKVKPKRYNKMEIEKISTTSLVKLSKEHTQLLSNNEVDVYQVYNENLTIDYIMFNSKDLEDTLYQLLNSLLHSYFKGEDLYLTKISEIKRNVDIFVDEFLSFKSIDISEDEWYRGSSKYLRTIKNKRFSYLSIESKYPIYILNYNVIADFQAEFCNKIRPNYISEHLTSEEKLFLKIVPTSILFNGIEEESLLKVIKHINYVKFTDSEVIYDYRENVTSIDYIIKGAIDFYYHGDKYIATLEKKQLFGEMSLDKNRKFRYATLKAKGDVLLLSITIDLNKRAEYQDVFFKLYDNVIHSLGEKINLLSKIKIENS